MIGSGKTVSQIAEELHLSVTTVSTYRARVLKKMNMATTAELMRYALRNHLVDWITLQSVALRVPQSESQRLAHKRFLPLLFSRWWTRRVVAVWGRSATECPLFLRNMRQWRRGPESNRCIKVLQTSALPTWLPRPSGRSLLWNIPRDAAQSQRPYSAACTLRLGWQLIAESW